jgi:hypothetical protein
MAMKSNASEDDRGEEPILALADPVAHDPDAPQERDGREWDEVQRQDHQVSPPWISEPGAGITRASRCREPHENQITDGSLAACRAGRTP